MKIFSSQYAKALMESLKESAPEKRDVVMDRFLEIIIRNNALRQMDEILSFIDIYDKKEKGVEDATITTAFPLADDIRSKIIKRLEKLTGRKIILNEKIDKSIIGGVIVKFNDYLFDASIRSKIMRLGKSLIS